jgi:hypothetical protein
MHEFAANVNIYFDIGSKNVSNPPASKTRLSGLRTQDWKRACIYIIDAHASI